MGNLGAKTTWSWPAWIALPFLLVAPILPDVLLVHDHGDGLHGHALAHGHDHGPHHHHPEAPVVPDDHDDAPGIVILSPEFELTRAPTPDTLVTVPTIARLIALPGPVHGPAPEPRTRDVLPGRPPSGARAVLALSHALLI